MRISQVNPIFNFLFKCLYLILINTNISVPYTENISKIDAINSIVDYFHNAKFDDFNFSENIIHFSDNHAFINFHYDVNLIIDKNDNIIIHYEIYIIQLIRITLSLVIFIAFFSSFGFSRFLWFSFIFSVVFYFVNLIFADAYIRKLIQKTPFYKAFDPIEQEGFV